MKKINLKPKNVGTYQIHWWQIFWWSTLLYRYIFLEHVGDKHYKNKCINVNVPEYWMKNETSAKRARLDRIGSEHAFTSSYKHQRSITRLNRLLGYTEDFLEINHLYAADLSLSCKSCNEKTARNHIRKNMFPRCLFVFQFFYIWVHRVGQSVLNWTQETFKDVQRATN